MLNSIVRGKQKGGWGALGVCLGLLSAPAFDVHAASFSTVFAFDLHYTSAGVIEGSGSNQGQLFGVTNDTSLSYGGSIYKVALVGGAPQVVYQLKDTDGYSPQATLLLGSDGYLYGTTYYGPRLGTNTATGTGTIFMVAQDGSGFQTLHRFDDIHGSSSIGNSVNDDGAYPTRALIEAGGYLYGVTQSGGANGTGTVFRLDMSSHAFELLHAFAAVDGGGINAGGEGAYPASSLTLASDGRLYGVTSGGGTNAKTTSVGTVGTGTIYSLNVDGSDFQTHYNFSPLDDTATSPSDSTVILSFNADGAQPLGNLLEVSPGVLLGTTSDGGDPDNGTVTGYGTVFRFDMAGSSLNTLYAFDNASGAVPVGDLVLSNGRVYGVTTTGSGSASPATLLGSIYSIDPVTADFVSEHPLVAAEGSVPTGGLWLASNGDLFGTVQAGSACTAVNGNGYGAVFRYSLATNVSSAGYSNCTVYDSGGGGVLGSGWLWLLAALGLAPPLRRRLFSGVRG